jgi:integrase
MNSLTKVGIEAAKPREKAYKLSDGLGLFLLVTKAGGRLWRFKYRFKGRENLLSLGSYPDVPLKLARDRRDEARKQVAAGIDPSAKRKAEKTSRADTFEAVAREWLALQEKAQAASTFVKARWLLEDILFPYIGSKQIALITASEVLSAVRKMEARGKHETAHRAVWKARQVFKYAIRTDRATNDPTSSLGGALVPQKVLHRPAITSPPQVGELLRAIDGYSGQPASEAALKLAPLVFLRPGELRGARWEEFDLDGKEPTWRIPGVRMKRTKHMGIADEHIVPLATQAVKILSELRPITGPEGLVFPGLRSGSRPISENTLNSALRRLGYTKDQMTPHGFRAIARTLLDEELHIRPDFIEHQLAHAVRDPNGRAYNRTTHFPERRKMMQEWADYLDTLKAGTKAVPNETGA